MTTQLCLLFLGKVGTAPQIGRAADITLGRTTVAQAERRFGKGLRHGGYHGKSRCTWFDCEHGLMISLDGRFENRRGEVIVDHLNVFFGRAGVPRSIPRIKLRSHSLGLLSGLHEGMTKRDVERIIGIHLNEFGRVTQHGSVKYDDPLLHKSQPGDRFTQWDAWFQFDEGAKLRALTLDAY